MCGICGILDKTQATDYSEAVERMCEALAHRGPDDAGTYKSKNMYLGHRRLSIIAPGNDGHQPMVSDCKRYVIVYNGEVYNFRELRSKLASYHFAGKSDTEVVLAAYIRWGDKCMEHFNGMFAFAIWDNVEETLFLARDRFGIKPLYYAFDKKGFVFSSEIRSIIAGGFIQPLVDDNALVDYVRFQTVASPSTIFREVKQLPPGHCMTIRKNGSTDMRYFKMSNIQPVVGDVAYIRSRIATILNKAVEKRLVSDVPYGAFLSGGIDSGILVALMSRQMDVQLNTFSVVFEEAEYSEAKYARMIADKYNTNHHEIKLSFDKFLSMLPDALNAMDHPSGDGLNTYIVSRLTKEAGVKMAVSGVGGDELFAGYDLFPQIHKLYQYRSLQHIPVMLRRLSGKLYYKYKKSQKAYKIAELLALKKWDIKSLHPIFRMTYSMEQANKLLFSKATLQQHDEHAAACKDDFVLSEISKCEMNSYLPNTLLRDTDQMSMSNALEVRVPFLDQDLVHFMLSVSDKVKYPSSPKKLLIDAFPDVLPPEVVNRKKMGFVLPWDSWMREELNIFCKEQLDYLSETRYFNGDVVQQAWGSFNNNHPLYSWSRLWPLISLAHWMKKNAVD